MSLTWFTDLFSKSPKPRLSTIAGGSAPSTDTQEYVAAEASRLFGWVDAAYVGTFPMLLPNALWTKPETWPGRADKLARGLRNFFPARLRDLEALIPTAVVEASGLPRDELAVQAYAAFLLERIEIAAVVFRGYRPEYVRLEGGARLHAAISRGKGTILWVTPAHSGTVLSKAALASEGFRLHHLSRRSHGVSNTRFGINVLNGMYRRGEAPFIVERITDDSIRQIGSSRRILDVLGENGVVTMTVSDAGTHLVEAPVLNGRIKVATGAPNFVSRSGASLLPVFSHRDGPRYVVEIGEPIVLEGMKRGEAFQHAVEAYAAQLEPYVRRYPTDFQGWPDSFYTEPSAP